MGAKLSCKQSEFTTGVKWVEKGPRSSTSHRKKNACGGGAKRGTAKKKNSKKKHLAAQEGREPAEG